MDLPDIEGRNRAAVLPQKQAGFFRVRFALLGGDLTVSEVRAVQALAEQYGRGEVRVGTRHEIEIPYVTRDNVEKVLTGLNRLGLRTEGVLDRPNVVTCPGAGPCTVGYLPTNRTCRQIEAFLRNVPGDLAVPPGFRIGISGCPNECSQPSVNELGFVGAVGAYGGQKAQGFEILAGGCLQGDGRLGERIAFVSPEDVVPTLRDVLYVYNEYGGTGIRFSHFFFDLGAEEFSRLLLDRLKKRMWFFHI